MLATLLAATVLVGPSSLHDFTMKDIHGKDVALSKFKGQVVLVVNVASKCGNTPQYAGLEAMYRANKAKGFAVLGFPANDFRGQEPGTDAEIYQFCTETYRVSFPMFSKISVAGETTHPLYQWLLANDGTDAPVDWNFAKFLVGRDGKVLARFPARTKPDTPEIAQAVAKALEEK